MRGFANDAASDDAYTKFRLEAMDQRWLLTGEESHDRDVRKRFAALARREREECLAWWSRRVQACISRDYWTLLAGSVRSYTGLRDVHEGARVSEDSARNLAAMPSALPDRLPAGTRMLFGEYHGRSLPTDATLKLCTVPVGMSLVETTTENYYVFRRENGTPASTHPTHVDWSAFASGECPRQIDGPVKV